MKIYFAGSIRGGREDKELYSRIIKLLSGYGEVLTEHVGNMKLSEEGERKANVSFIYNRDLSWLTSSDVLVAEVSTPSLGVGYEIAKAEFLGKKVLCLYKRGSSRKLSAMIAGNSNVVVGEYEDLNQVKILLDKFFDWIASA